MKNHYRLLFALSLVLLNSPGAFAQSNEEEDIALIYGDQATVSIATGSKQTLRRAPAVATVITAENIKAMGATDLDEVLETVAGMHVARSASSYTPLYVIRGIYSQHAPQTLMLQNGLPTTTQYLSGKGQVWGGLPVDNIARIEVIRGPGSALYGADAYAGVINIITKTAANTPGTQSGIRGGSFNTKDAWVQHGGQWGVVDVAGYLRVGSTDGFRQTITADTQTARDTRFGTHASLAPGSVNTGHDAADGSLDLAYDKWRLRTGYKLRNNVGTGAGIASALDPVGKAKSERITADLSWTSPNLSQDWGTGLTASYLEYNDTVPTPYMLYPSGTQFPTGTFPDGMIGAPEKRERDIRLSAFSTYSGFSNHSLRFGLGHDDLNLYATREYKNFTFSATGAPVPTGAVIDFTNTAPFMLPQRRKVDYIFAQDEWDFAKDWTLTAGVRHDNYSDFGSTTNPRLALVWDATLDLTAKLLYGNAFRAPSFSESYSINNPVSRGNPNLRPETNQTWEAAFTWHARRDTQVNLNFFRYEMKDIIRIAPNPAPAVGSTYNNTGNQHGNGMELETVLDYSSRLRLTGNYSFQESIDDATGQDAGYTPHHRFYVRSDWRYSSGWFTSAQVNRVLDRARAAGDNRPNVPDYTTVDLTLRSPTKGQWDFSSSVRNLFNADVREPSLAPGLIPNDLPMAPRSLWVQATYKM
ncbi:MAG: iron complex outermembrane recepter [Gallionellaceae bacterium]|nr:MAG: iron complex outermembrane recepter [Gallionellaceae bacterium]